jgi:hypothetical protein
MQKHIFPTPHLHKAQHSRSSIGSTPNLTLSSAGNALKFTAKFGFDSAAQKKGSPLGVSLEKLAIVPA